jgi:hypothetical protein
MPGKTGLNIWQFDAQARKLYLERKAERKKFMSNTIINVRFWCIHFKVTRNWRPSFSWNEIHRKSFRFAVYDWPKRK